MGIATKPSLEELPVVETPTPYWRFLLAPNLTPIKDFALAPRGGEVPFVMENHTVDLSGDERASYNPEEASGLRV